MYKKYVLIVISISIIPMLTIYFITYNLLANGMINQLKEKEIKTLTGYQNKVDLALENINDIAIQLANNYSNYNYYENELYRMPLTEVRRILQLNYSMILGNGNINSFYVYYKEGTKIIVNDHFAQWDSFYDKEWLNLYNELSEKVGNEGISNFSIREIYTDSSYQYKQKVSTIIVPFSISRNEKNGYIVINIDIDKLINNYIDIQQSQYQIISSEGRMISGNDTKLDLNDNTYQERSSVTIEGKKKLIFRIISPNNQWQYISITDELDLLSPLESLKNTMLFIIVFCFILTVVVSFVISRRLYEPIGMLFESFKELLPNPNADKKIDKLGKDFDFVIKNFKEQILEKKELELKIEDNEKAIIENKLRKILRNEIIVDEEISKEKFFGSNISGYIVLTVENYENSTVTNNVMRNSFDNNIRDTLNKIIGTSYRFYSSDIDKSRVFIVIIIDNNSEYEKSKLDITRFCNEIIELTEGEYGNTFIGIGSFVSNFEDLNRSYIESLNALKHKIFSDDKRVFVYDDLTRYEELVVVQHPIELEKRLVQAIKSRNSSESEKIIDEILEGIMKFEFSPDYVYSWLNSIRDMLFAIPDSLGFMIDEIIFRDYKELYKKGERIININQARSYLKEVCDNIIQGLNIKLSNKNTELIEDIKEYILKHVGDDVSLVNVASHYGMSSTYLSTIFKQETGENFVQYVSDIKMQLAKRLITETNIKIRDVSEKVGYLNENSFYYVFKKITGKTPNQYRKDSRKGKA